VGLTIVPDSMLANMNIKECSDMIVVYLYVTSILISTTVLMIQTSFFSRYTKDIVSFANQNTGGKIVSVLEGGYSDRALTSAAMGHVIGMLNEKGKGEWWSEPELINVSLFAVVRPYGAKKEMI
jgi:hypothetical protein